MQTIRKPSLIKKVALLLFFALVLGTMIAAADSDQPVLEGVPATVLSNQPVVTGPDMRYNIIGSHVVGDEVYVRSRNPVGTMVFIGSEKVHGWFPSWAVDMHGVDFDSLPVWEDPMKNAVLRSTG